MRFTLLFAFIFLVRYAPGQETPAPSPATPPASEPAPAPTSPATTNAATGPTEVQASLKKLAQSNRDLLALLKEQQAVLTDIQYDRRLQSRQIQNLEERLENALTENAQLQSKVATLEAAAAQPPVNSNLAATNKAPGQPAPPVEEEKPPDTYLPPPNPDGGPGGKTWHRLFTLKGDSSKQTDLFHIQGHTWRVLWHNQDKPGKAYHDTSALFINAFPKDDTIPQQVCSKLGSGGDMTVLQGPGNYYLKIEASGGGWELAIEDFQ